MVGLVALHFGGEAVMDAVNLVIAAHEALTKRHGDRYRTLERRIETIIESGDFGAIEHHDLGDGHIELSAPPNLTELIRDARAFGVIQ
jgi:hypothetical protein